MRPPPQKKIRIIFCGGGGSKIIFCANPQPQDQVSGYEPED